MPHGHHAWVALAQRTRCRPATCTLYSNNAHALPTQARIAGEVKRTADMALQTGAERAVVRVVAHECTPLVHELRKHRMAMRPVQAVDTGLMYIADMHVSHVDENTTTGGSVVLVPACAK